MENQKLDLNAMPLQEMPAEPVKNEIPKELKTLSPEENRKGIVATGHALNFLVALGSAIKLSLEDEKFTIVDALNFYEPAKKLLPFVGSIKEIPSELGDVITEEEQAEIIKIIEKSGFLQGNSEAVAIEALDLILHMKNFIFKNFINKN